jgi:acyl-CoA synthetase (NDP forming)
VPNFRQPDGAVKALEAMFKYAEWRQVRRDAPPRYEFDADAIRATVATVRGRGLKTVGEREAREIAAACGIPVPLNIFAADDKAAAAAAEKIGYPVVVKVSSDDILHKSDAGGVKVGIKDAEGVRQAFRQIMQAARAYKADARLDGVLVQQMAPKGREVIIGVNRDAQFGPVIMFGLGGVYVEVLKDVTFRVAPLTLREAREMIDDIRAARILHAFRGDPEGDLEALAECLTRVSQLAVDFPEFAECDLNPVMVYPKGKGVMGLDVRFGLA